MSSPILETTRYCTLEKFHDICTFPGLRDLKKSHIVSSPMDSQVPPGEPGFGISGFLGSCMIRDQRLPKYKTVLCRLAAREQNKKSNSHVSSKTSCADNVPRSNHRTVKNRSAQPASIVKR